MIRDLIDEFAPDETLSEKDKAIECIKALSRIDGTTIVVSGYEKEAITRETNSLMKYFEELLKELDR